MKKKPAWQVKYEAEEKVAKEKGWLPQKPWKGRLVKDMIGRAILTGWLDSPPRAGLIVELHPADYRSLDVFFPESGTVEEVEKSQVFSIGGKAEIWANGDSGSVSYEFCIRFNK